MATSNLFPFISRDVSFSRSTPEDTNSYFKLKPITGKKNGTSISCWHQWFSTAVCRIIWELLKNLMSATQTSPQTPQNHNFWASGINIFLTSQWLCLLKLVSELRYLCWKSGILLRQGAGHSIPLRLNSWRLQLDQVNTLEDYILDLYSLTKWQKLSFAVTWLSVTDRKKVIWNLSQRILEIRILSILLSDFHNEDLRKNRFYESIIRRVRLCTLPLFWKWEVNRYPLHPFCFGSKKDQR